MSDGVTLTGTLGVVVFVLLLASFGATWWLAYRAIRRAPKSRLARSSWGSLCAAMIANFTSNQWAGLAAARWLVYPLQAAALIIAIVALRTTRSAEFVESSTSTPERAAVDGTSSP